MILTTKKNLKGNPQEFTSVAFKVAKKALPAYSSIKSGCKYT